MPGDKVYGEVVPGRKRVQVTSVRALFFVLGRAFQTAARFDREIAEEIEELPQPFSIMMKVLPAGPCLVLEKDKRGRLKYRGQREGGRSFDLTICFKNIDSAFLVVSARLGTARAYAEHRTSVQGDLPHALVLIRCLNRIQTYLFPALIAQRVVKRLPAIPFHQKLAIRFLIYGVGLPFGL